MRERERDALQNSIPAACCPSFWMKPQGQGVWYLLQGHEMITYKVIWSSFLPFLEPIQSVVKRRGENVEFGSVPSL